ncbi:MAG TPA: type II toxin-antitoxin system death-on-curing family toxin [Chitinophagaceae bacterium]
MISLSEILKLHELSIQKYGGSHGVRDEGLLDSAIARLFQTFGGEDLYASAIEKAAAIAESLIINHPFVDGNKRAGFLAMLAVLKMGKMYLIASEEDAYQFTISTSTGEIRFDEIVQWLKNNTRQL